VFKESDAVILNEVDIARGRLDSLQVEGLRFVISPSRLSSEDRHALYFGLKRRNTVVLFEPRADKESLRINKDVLAWAKKAMAAETLAASPNGDSEKMREFTKIASDQKASVTDAIKKVNYAYVQIHRTGPTAADAEYTLEPIQPLNKESVLLHISRNLFPSAYIAEHIQNRASELIGRKVSALETEYRNTLGFPVIVYVNEFQRAIEHLVIDGVFNLAHPSGTQHAGETPTLSAAELMDAVLVEPSARPAATLSPRPQPSGGATTIAALSRAAGGIGNIDSLPLGPTAQQVSTGFCESRQQLRQEIAARLDQADGRPVVRVRIGMTFESRTVEMSTLPTFLRGSLAGSGTFNGEVTLEFPGSFTKAAVEDMMERLPDFSPGSAKVTLTLGS
jgi:hypothetical protein